MKKIICCLLLVCLFLPCYADDLPNLHICTVASRRTKGLTQLLDTCKYFGVEIDVLGMGLPYKGNGQKLTYVRKYIDTIPDDELVLFVDAYDVLILSNKEKMILNFLEMDTQLVFAAETNLFPKRKVGHLARKFPKSPNKFKYLNSGTYMGYASAIRKLLDSINYSEGHSDQAALIPYFIDHQDEISLDHTCKLFCAMHGTRFREYDLDFDSKTVRCKITDSIPCVIHGNGHSTYLYQLFYDKLFPESQFPTSG